MTYGTTPDTPKWVEAIGVVHFDLLQGQTMEILFPPLPFSQVHNTEISFLCFPDANLVSDGDFIHDFVYASNAFEYDASYSAVQGPKKDAPASPSAEGGNSNTNSRRQSSPSGLGNGAGKAAYDHSSIEWFCSTLFRQRKDASITRGAQQKAIVVFSRYPFPLVHHQILRQVCASLFDTPTADGRLVVEQAYREIASWPLPLPMKRYEGLQLFRNQLLPFTTPWYHPSQLRRLGWSDATPTTDPCDLDRWQCLQTFENATDYASMCVLPLRRYLASPSCDLRTMETILQRLQVTQEHEIGKSPVLQQSSVWEAIIEDIRFANVPAALQSSSSSTSTADDEASLLTSKLTKEEEASIASLLPYFRHSLHHQQRATRTLVSKKNAILEALQQKAHEILTSPTFATSSCLGPFQAKQFFFAELELHHALYPHLPKLWKLWELLITGAPLAVVSFDAPTVTAVCLALTGLVAPLPFVGVLRPYVTINNREVDLFIPEEGATLHSTLIGMTNPFFVRRCLKWPHFLCLSTESDEGITHKTLPADSDKREKQQFKLKNRMFCSRHYLVTTKKNHVDSSNLSYTSLKKGSFVDLCPDSAEGSPLRSLRSEFQDLTLQFLSPIREIVHATLEKDRPFFCPPADVGVGYLGPQAILTALQNHSGTLPIAHFKTRSDMLSVYSDFLHTNMYRAWLSREWEAAQRRLLLSVESLGSVLLLQSNPLHRYGVLDRLQDLFETIVSRPLLDVAYAQKLSALCAPIPLLRLSLSA